MGDNIKPKYKVPVISFEELIKMETENKKIKGPYKIKAEDAEKALKYFEKR